VDSKRQGFSAEACAAGKAAPHLGARQAGDHLLQAGKGGAAQLRGQRLVHLRKGQGGEEKVVAASLTSQCCAATREEAGMGGKRSAWHQQRNCEGDALLQQQRKAWLDSPRSRWLPFPPAGCTPSCMRRRDG
jgi:hypothetical protein